MLPLSNSYTNCKKIKIHKVNVWCRAANEQIIQLASSHGLTGSVSRITPKKVCSHRRVTHINSSEEKKKKKIEFPATNTHTNNSGTSYLWKDSWQNSSDLWWRRKKKRREPLHHKQRALQRRQSQASVAHQDDSNFITCFIWAGGKKTTKKNPVRMSQVCQLWSKILMMKETRRESGGGCGSLTPAAGCQTLMPRDRSSTPGY